MAIRPPLPCFHFHLPGEICAKLFGFINLNAAAQLARTCRSFDTAWHNAEAREHMCKELWRQVIKSRQRSHVGYLSAGHVLHAERHCVLPMTVLTPTHGGIPAMLRAMREHTASVGTQAAACKAITALAGLNWKNKAVLGGLGVINIIVTAMSLHCDSETLQINACEALEAIAIDSASNCKALCSADGITRVCGAMIAFPRSALVHANACGALCNISSFFPTANCAITTAGGVAHILTSLRWFPTSAVVQHKGILALASIVGACEIAAVSVLHGGGVELCLSAMAAMPCVEAIHHAACCLLARLGSMPGAAKSICAALTPHVRTVWQYPCTMNLLQSLYLSARVHGDEENVQGDDHDLDLLIMMGLVRVTGMQQQARAMIDSDYPNPVTNSTEEQVEMTDS